VNELKHIAGTIAAKEAMLRKASMDIWTLAELPYEEHRSADILCGILKQEGFALDIGVADIPTAFVGRWSHGEGGAVMGFLGEYDALDILSQEAACFEKKPVKTGAPGHGCGHNALGVGALGAALAVKEYLTETNTPGTVIYYGCAAEEGAGAKQFMARAGLFDGVDFVYTWHPGSLNAAGNATNNAILGAYFTFTGLTSHAGGSPHLGRSALDAAELMSVGVNYLREHMIDGARVHYAYLDAGGEAANVVQDHAVVKYEVRAPRVDQMMDLWKRVIKVSEGAAHMTETTVEHELLMAFSDYYTNGPLAEVASQALQEVGPPVWDEGDFALALGFRESFGDEVQKSIRERIAQLYGEDRVEEKLAQPLDTEVHLYNPDKVDASFGSTDVGDVGYAVPTFNFGMATCCLGNVGHTWQMTAQSGSEIAHKGMLQAAKAMALAAIYTAQRPEVVEKAKAIVLKKNSGKYQCPLPDSVKPPIGRY